MPRPSGRRPGALLVSAALAAGLSLTGPAVQAAEPTPAGSSAAGWLATQLTDGVVTGAWGPDYGLTVDAGLAIADLGGNAALVRQVRSALAPHVDSYTTGADFGAPDDVYAAASAKLLVWAQVAGADPRSYGGRDLVARTADRVATAGPIAGRLEDRSTYGDYVNVIGQAFAARGLTRAGSPLAGPVTDFLLQQQCDGGWFRLYLTSDKAAPDQGCVDGAAGSEPDTDATALAVLQLVGSGSTAPAVTSAVDRAVGWLERAQAPDGSLGGSVATPTPNANSTGLAAWALAADGRCRPAGRAAAWVAGLQVGPQPAGSPLAEEEGAIAYDRAALDAAAAGGITDASRDQWRRTTAQAGAGLDALLGRTAPVTLGVPTGFVRAGASVPLTVTGGSAGDRFCLSGPGIDGARTVAVAADGSATATLTLPTRTGAAAYVLGGRDADRSAAVRVLAPLRIAATVRKKKIERGRTQVVRVGGLEAGEKVKVRFRGRTVGKGVADASGAFRARFEATGRPGRTAVVVTGQFPDIRTRTLRFTVR